jgi:hypothetical protein
MTIEAMKQWAEAISKAYDMTAWGHTQRASEILKQTRNRICAAIAEAEKQEPVAHSVVAGALFDFMGWLTSRDKRLTLSSTDEAGPAVEAITEFAKMRGLSLDDAQVEHWQAILTTPPAMVFDASAPLVMTPHPAFAKQPTAQPAPVQEPRCAVIVEVFAKDWRLDYMSLSVGKHRLYTQEYVYTTPQPCPTCEALARTVMMDQTAHDTKRQPLTDEQIDAVCAPLGFAQMSPREVARAIEAAHGIGEKK